MASILYRRPPIGVLKKVLVMACIQSAVLTIHATRTCRIYQLSTCQPQSSQSPNPNADCMMYHRVTLLLLSRVPNREAPMGNVRGCSLTSYILRTVSSVARPRSESCHCLVQTAQSFVQTPRHSREEKTYFGWYNPSCVVQLPILFA